MFIIGCDFHMRFQQIAVVDFPTDEIIERRFPFNPSQPPTPNQGKLTAERQLGNPSGTAASGGCMPLH